MVYRVVHIEQHQVCFRLSPHRTTTNLRATKEFTLSFATQRDVAQSDYFGMVSANDVPDKVARAGFTVTKSTNINAPIINEYPLTLECRVLEIMERDNGGCFVIGEIVNTIADPSILTDGNIDLDKLQPVVFDAASLSYRSVGITTCYKPITVSRVSKQLRETVLFSLCTFAPPSLQEAINLACRW